jgi:hypothetical protein
LPFTALLAVVLFLAIGGCDKGRAQSIDLHKVDWTNATVPGSICGAKHPIRLRDGHAVVRSTRWVRGGLSRVTVSSGWDPVVYGDLDGDGNDEAALGVDCNNGGGTASGVLAYARVVFTAGERSPRVVAVVTPHQRPNRHALPTLLQVRILKGTVIAREFWYGPSDGTCCPSGHSTTVWEYGNGALRPVSTLVVKRPHR